MLKSAQVWAGLFVTKDATGALATPGAGPAGVLYVDGVANGASVTITGSNPYKFSVTLPSLTAGQSCSMYITATISSIATASIVAYDTSDTKRVSDLNDIAAGAQMDLVNAPNATGITAIVTAIWAVLTSALTTVNSIGKLLVTDVDAKISSASAPTVGQIDTQLSGTHGAGLWGGAGGTGSKSCTINVKVAGVPIDGTYVWVTTDIGGASVVASGTTDAFGNVTFLLDPGTYYFWKQHSSYNFTNPESGVVV